MAKASTFKKVHNLAYGGEKCVFSLPHLIQPLQKPFQNQLLPTSLPQSVVSTPDKTIFSAMPNFDLERPYVLV